MPRSKPTSWVVFVSDDPFPHESAARNKMGADWSKGSPDIADGPFYEPGLRRYTPMGPGAIAFVDWQVAHWRALGYAVRREVFA